MKEVISKIHREQIEEWGYSLGFQSIGFSTIDLSETEIRLQQWLDKDYHGDMSWMASHGTKRTRPDELVAGTCSVISVRMDYLPPDTTDEAMVLNHPELAYISRYALGRDYHKVIRKRLQQLATHITQHFGEFGYRVFVDSAPVMEKPLAVNAGIGWMGKHTNILSRSAGSWFFLGELYTDIPLESSVPKGEHCGTCQQCIDICPTQAIVAPYLLDARRCISYLTIEHKGSIPVELRPLLGNRIYGCDDCQLVCPWNRFAQYSDEADFAARHHLDSAHLLDLFRWTEQEFLDRLQGSPIRRIGFERWQRNIAVALGNGISRPSILDTLSQSLNNSSDMVKEHITWALNRLISDEK